MNLYDAETNEEITLPRLLHSGKQEWYVLNVDAPSGPGKSGKVRCCTPGDTDTRYFYPQVFGCYIADAPRENGARRVPITEKEVRAIRYAYEELADFQEVIGSALDRLEGAKKR